MKNTSLYKLPYRSAHATEFPLLRNSDQQVVWSKIEFEEGTVLLYLEDFDLTEENLKAAERQDTTSQWAADLACPLSGTSGSPAEKYYNVWERAKDDFEETGKIKGSLYLAPNLQKVWISHLDSKYLEEIS